MEHARAQFAITLHDPFWNTCLHMLAISRGFKTSFRMQLVHSEAGTSETCFLDACGCIWDGIRLQEEYCACAKEFAHWNKDKTDEKTTCSLLIPLKWIARSICGRSMCSFSASVALLFFSSLIILQINLEWLECLSQVTAGPKAAVLKPFWEKVVELKPTPKESLWIPNSNW